MNDGLKPEHRQAIIDMLASNPSVERIVLFGSRAMGAFTPTSDVDLVLFGDDLTLSDQAALAEAVAELPIAQRVDILVYHRIEHEALRAHIRKHGVEWFARKTSATRGAGMAGEWMELPFSQAVMVNPTVPLTRGTAYPFVDMAAVNASSRCAFATETRVFDGGGSRFLAGDTLMARITPCLENGKIAQFCGAKGQPAFGLTEFIVIRGRDGVSDTSYVYYLTKWEGVSGYAISQMTGTSGRQRVPTTALDHLVVPLPPLSEQRAIAHILGTLDDKIELNRRMSATLEAMARALFKAWFVDFEPVRAKCGRGDRPVAPTGWQWPQHILDLFPDRLVDSELGEIPEGWEVKGLDEIARFLNGLALQKYPPTDDRWLPVIKIAQLRVGNTKGADRASADLDPDYVVQDGDILFSWSGSLECVFWAGGPGALNQHLFKVTSDLPRWLCYLGIHHHLDAFRHIAAGKATTMGHIQRHHLTDANLPVPPPRLLQAMDLVLSPIIESTWRRAVQSRTLAALRDALLPRLISGALRVKDAEKFLQERGL